MTLFELEASLTLDTKDFSNAVNGAEAEGKTLAQRLGADADSIKSAFGNAFAISIGQLMADGFKAALGAAWEFVEGSVEVAANAEETNNKIDAIFGDKSADVHRWAKTTKEQFGISSTAAKQYAAQLAGIMSSDSLELSSEQIFEMSTSLVELAGDLASFHNYDLDTVWFKILSGMRGETEAIEDLGIDMRATAVGAMFGITGGAFGQLSPREQMLMRYQYLMANTTVAQGDFARTSESYSNQLKLFEQNMLELQATIGESLLPTLTGLLQIMNDLFTGEESAADGIDHVKNSYEKNLAQIATTTTNALALVDALDELSQTSEDAASSETWAAILAELEQTIPGIGDLIDDQTGKIEGGTQALRDFIDNWRELAMVSAEQKALQDMTDEYIALGAELFRLQWDQDKADRFESENLKKMQAYERSFAGKYEVALRAAGFSESQIKDKYAQDWALGASGLFSTYAKGYKTFDELLNAQVRLNYGKSMSFGDLWKLGGGTREELYGMFEGWKTFSEEYQENKAVDHTERIKELEETIAAQDEQLNYVKQMMESRYGIFWDTPEAPSETTTESSSEETAEAEAAEVAEAAEEAATAAQQVTETAAQMTADANSTDAMLITVLQGLPGNIATAVGGMSVTLDGDTIVGYVSAALAREARGSQNTGG